MPQRDDARVRADLGAALGTAVVHWDDATLAQHSHDTWSIALLRLQRGLLTDRPACVITPESTGQVARTLQYAGHRRVPVVPFGAGSGVCGGVLPAGGAIVIDMRRMRSLLELNETALTARVQAGMMGHHFEEALNARGYTMGHFPQSISLSTVGGWVATRAAGQFSTRYGAIEDMLLGLEAVLPDGLIVRINPTPRRAAGPDLRQLFLGSEGTLGVVTELSVRVFPLPESRKLLCFSFPDFDAGLEALRSITRAGWKPPVLRLYDSIETQRHFGQWANDDACFLLAITEGAPQLTAVEAEACHTVCTAHGAVALGDPPVNHWLAERNNVPGFDSFLQKGFVLDTIEVATGWDRIHDLYHEVTRAVREVKSLVVVSGHSSHSYPQGTNIYFTFVARPEDPAEAEATYFKCWEQAMEATLRCGGTIAHHHGIGRLRTRWMRAEHGAGLDVLRAVKRALDPHGIMNPGVLFPAEDWNHG
jgi:alkyldihydroxyacetonephosphate synthase